MFDLERILQAARAGRLAASPVHGEAHWKAVSVLGLDLCRLVPGSDSAVVFLFGLLHDCRRKNEHHDPRHGARAAELLDELADAIALEPERLQLLARACRVHTSAAAVSDPTLAVCLDADRLNLWRCGIVPQQRFLFTAAARDPRTIEQSRRYHLAASTKTWQQLARQARR
jgi:uncharacterized protein